MKKLTKKEIDIFNKLAEEDKVLRLIVNDNKGDNSVSIKVTVDIPVRRIREALN